MSYSTNPITLRRIEATLAPLTIGKTLRWDKPAGEDHRWAGRWAYKIREALSIAQLYPEQFERLAAVAPLVRVVVHDARIVEAYVESHLLLDPPTVQSGREIDFEA